MRKNKNILKKGMILAAVSTMVVTMAPAIPAYAYGEADSKTGQAAFNAATTGSADYQSWLTGTWQGGTQDFANTNLIALTPGSTANDLGFAWYSKTTDTVSLTYGLKADLSDGKTVQIATKGTGQKDKDGNEIPNYPTEDGDQPKKDIPGYRFVETKKLPKGDIEHVYEQVTTSYVDENGTPIPGYPTEDGQQPKKEIPGYEFVKTIVDENGNRVTGQKNIGGAWYYFSPAQIKDEFGPDGYYYDKEGKRTDLGTNRYYQLHTHWYYIGKDG